MMENPVCKQCNPGQVSDLDLRCLPISLLGVWVNQALDCQD